MLGDAYLYNLSVRQDMDSIRNFLGVCPQVTIAESNSHNNELVLNIPYALLTCTGPTPFPPRPLPPPTGPAPFPPRISLAQRPVGGPHSQGAHAALCPPKGNPSKAAQG